MYKKKKEQGNCSSGTKGTMKERTPPENGSAARPADDRLGEEAALEGDEE